MNKNPTQTLWAYLIGETPAIYLAQCDLNTLNSFADEELRSHIGRKPRVIKTIRVITELTKHLMSQTIEPGQQIRSSADVFNMYHVSLGLEKQENFLILLLNVKNRLIKEVHVSRGSLTASIVHPREVFVHAIKEQAAGVILLHNHPSGDPTPSSDDIELTDRIRKVGEVVGIKVLDHVIVCLRSHFSLADEGCFDG